MNYRDCYRANYTQSSILPEERDSEIDFVIEMLTGLKPIDIILGKTIDESFENQINEILTKHLSTGIPLQYVVGKAFFAGNKYFVDSNTLIPRPETELIVDFCKKNFSKDLKLKILDIGTGSGCVAIELAKNFINSEITAIDICHQALDIAGKNAEYHKVSDRIHFLKSDIFLKVKDKFDIIVSNPPYIPYSEKNTVQDDVRKFEPKNALFADENGLYFYKKIISEAKNFLLPKGVLVFEVGYNQAEKVKQLLTLNKCVNIEFTKDCDSIDRVVSAVYN